MQAQADGRHHQPLHRAKILIVTRRTIGHRATAPTGLEPDECAIFEKEFQRPAHVQTTLSRYLITWHFHVPLDGSHGRSKPDGVDTTPRQKHQI
jgi:hypothetical protein